MSKMLLRNIIPLINSLRFMVEKLTLQSSLGKRFLLDSTFMIDAKSINNELNLIENVLDILNSNNQSLINKLQIKLMQIRDINGSVNRISRNMVMDDVELFEIKSFALISKEIYDLQKLYGIEIIEIPDLSTVISILDPNKSNIPSFYIYDIYSTELAEVRNQIKIEKAKENADQHILNDLHLKSETIESNIREYLSKQIKEHITKLSLAVNNIAHLDLIIAKSILAKEMNLTKPTISNNNWEYVGMVNPQIQDSLSKQKRQFQPVDITLDNSICFITGANMAGKTVILKTLALCQYLTQFGFFVPAQKAKVAIVNKVMISIGDEQSEQQGLSSFASEMLKINEMVDSSQNNENVLILIDELARTTNPVEGRAIVNAVANIFFNNKTTSVITTHYSGLSKQCRKLRVKGLDKEIPNGVINKNNINDYIDYRLVEDETGDVPHEALRIAQMLNINQEIIDCAQDELNK